MSNIQRPTIKDQEPTILVTGGTGLVGAHLLVYLVNKGHKIRAIHRKQSDFSNVKQVFSYYTQSPDDLFASIEWVEADLNDIPALQQAFDGIIQVYHCAAIVSFDDRDYELMRQTNIEGTANMVNIALKHKIDKFCYVSSVATLDNQIKKGEVTEQNIWNPALVKFDYAITKYGGEMEVWRGTQEGLNAVIVNPGVILGSGFWQNNTGLIFSRVSKGFKFYTKGVTGFVGVWDVVKAMVKLMESDITNERYVLVSENLSYQEVLSKIANTMDKPEPSRNVSPFVNNLVWILDSIRAFILRQPKVFTKHTVRSAHEKTYYSSEKIENKLLFNFEPMQSVIERCVSDYIKDH